MAHHRTVLTDLAESGRTRQIYVFTARAGEFFFQVVGRRRRARATLDRVPEDVVRIWPVPSEPTEWRPRPGQPMTDKHFERVARFGLVDERGRPPR